MKIHRSLLILLGLSLIGVLRGPASEPVVLRTDYSTRLTRLPEIAVHRYVAPLTGGVIERRLLIDAHGVLTFVEDVTVPVGVTIPAAAFDKLLVHGTAWSAYGRLGPRALANFELKSDQPIMIADRMQFEVQVREDAQPEPGRLLNISMRGRASAVDKAVAGFVVSDRPRRVLVRAVGPGLTQFGVAGVLADPFVTIFRGNLPYYFNGDWGNRYDAHETAGAAAAVGAFPLAGGSKDAALVVELLPGAYTVHVEPESGAGGEVLLEVYSVP